MKNKTYFISDLHLSHLDSRITERFNHFVEKNLKDAERIYILGDLFEYWIGDDGVETVGMTDVINSLKAITSSGIKGFFVAGNRDFLVGNSFEKMTGFTILPDFSLIDLYGTKTLILHGDALCSDDTTHQEFRQNIMLNKNWHDQILKMSITERIELAKQIRGTSDNHKMSISNQIMDVNEATVMKKFLQYGVEQIIHGHTHRPNKHHYKKKERIVLGDWYSNASYLRSDKNSNELFF